MKRKERVRFGHYAATLEAPNRSPLVNLQFISISNLRSNKQLNFDLVIPATMSKFSLYFHQMSSSLSASYNVKEHQPTFSFSSAASERYLICLGFNIVFFILLESPFSYKAYQKVNPTPIDSTIQGHRQVNQHRSQPHPRLL